MMCIKTLRKQDVSSGGDTDLWCQAEAGRSLVSLRLPWATDLLPNSQSYTERLCQKSKNKQKTKNKNKTAQNMLKNSKS